MKANELRIGNYIFDKKGEVFSVSGFYIHHISTLENLKEKIPFKPIPLTEEWLLKLNFKETRKEKQWRFGNRLVVKRNDSFFDYASEVELKYVHKLQNFFFETSTELTLNK